MKKKLIIIFLIILILILIFLNIKINKNIKEINKYKKNKQSKMYLEGTLLDF